MRRPETWAALSFNGASAIAVAPSPIFKNVRLA
jgi:hypothetical protein